MASFDRKEHVVIDARTSFEGFDRWHFLKTEFFLVSALLTEFDGLRENKEVLYFVVYARSLLIEFDEMNCSFCFRENVVDRI